MKTFLLLFFLLIYSLTLGQKDLDLVAKYYDSIYQLEKFEVVDKYFMYKSDEMTRNLYAAGLRTAEMVVISQNIMKWVDMIELGTEENIERQLMEMAAKELGKPVLSFEKMLEYNGNYDYEDDPIIIDDSDENNLKYNESSLIPVLVNAIKELKQRLDAAGI